MNDNNKGVTGAAKTVTGILGNTVSGVSNTVGGVVGASTYLPTLLPIRLPTTHLRI